MRAAVFRSKQLLRPDPCASARSATPLPVTVLRDTRLPRGTHRGPGSGAPGVKETKRAVENTATP